MAHSLIDKITNFLMPVDEFQQPEESTPAGNKVEFTVHSPAELKVLVKIPRQYQDALVCADRLKANHAVIVNLQLLDARLQQSVSDFLNGVCYVTGGSVEKVSDFILIYVPAKVEVSKELYAYSVPTYIKARTDKVFNL